MRNVYETFNAGSAVVKIKGVSAHPMSAKGVMVNPPLVAVDLINSFDILLLSTSATAFAMETETNADNW